MEINQESEARKQVTREQVQQFVRNLESSMLKAVEEERVCRLHENFIFPDGAIWDREPRPIGIEFKVVMYLDR